MAKTQAKGSATRILLDMETSPGVLKSFANRLPVVVPFNSVDLQGARNLNRSDTIQGDRSSTEPFQGFKDVSGNIVIPIDSAVTGYFLRLAMSQLEYTRDNPNDAQNKLSGTSITLTIATGAGTFSGAQPNASVGDRVIYESGGVIYTAYLTAETSDTLWNVRTSNDDAGTNAADVTAANVLFIVKNNAAATPGTLSISSNVMTFGTAQPNVAVGALVIYNGTSRAKVVTKNSNTEVVVEGINGADVADSGSVDLESIELDAKFKHRFIVHPTKSNPTGVIEVSYGDLEVPYYEAFKSCKVDSMEIGLGGDGELTTTVNIMGGESVPGFQPYDKPDHLTGTPTITISSGTPYTGTVDAAQASAVAGDAIVYIDTTGEEQIVIIDTVSDSSNFNLVGSPVTGADMVVKAIYPSASSESIALSRFADRFQQFDAATYIDGSYIKLFRETSLTFSNNCDGDQYLIGGGATREEIPEGIASVSGNLSAVFKSQLLLDKAKNFTTTALKFVLTRSTTGNILILEIPEVKFQEKSPAVNGPAGILYDPTFEGFKNTGASVLVAELIGPEMGYPADAS